MASGWIFAGWVLWTFLAGIPAWGALSCVGMFFETVNRIWRMDCPPWRLGDPGGVVLGCGEGWCIRKCVKLAEA